MIFFLLFLTKFFYDIYSSSQIKSHEFRKEQNKTKASKIGTQKTKKNKKNR